MDIKSIATIVGALIFVYIFFTQVPSIIQPSETPMTTNRSPINTATETETVSEAVTATSTVSEEKTETESGVSLPWEDIENLEGVFVYNASLGGWIKQDLGSRPWTPPDKSTYIMYFKNLNCPACKAFDPVWDKYVEDYVKKGRGEPVTPVVVSCTSFSQQCSDATARATFIAYQVPFSPAVLIWHNGTVVYYGQAPQTPEDINKLVQS